MKTLATKNLEFNNNYRVEGFINGQAVGITTRLKYRRGSLADSGSEVVAAYNACLILGEPKRIQDIAYFCEQKGIMLYSKLYAAGDFLKEMGHSVSTSFVSGLFDNAIKECAAALVTYKTGLKTHTFAIEPNENGITAYNISPRALEERCFASVADMIRELQLKSVVMQTVSKN